MAASGAAEKFASKLVRQGFVWGPQPFSGSTTLALGTISAEPACSENTEELLARRLLVCNARQLADEGIIVLFVYLLLNLVLRGLRLPLQPHVADK